MKAEPLLWALPESAPLLIQASGRGRARRFVVIELSTERLKTDLFPDLVSRYLGSHRSTDFQIGVLGGLHNTLLYQSDPSLSSDTFRYWDEKVFLFEGFRFFSTAGTGDKWMLVAKDRQGSLAAAAAKLSHRWLAVNFGVLIVLALGLATIVVSMLRAQAFLKLQMEFVAGVSHELRTPLSVIGSAADNLAEGVVRSAKDVQEYGALIRSECRRLSGLVEQTLRFSAAKADIRSRDIQFFRITDVIDRALSAAVTAIDGNRLSLEKIVDPNLPMVRADPYLLSECLLNLISNALKYGGDAQWLGIRAQTVETGHGTGVQITVEDRGIGISAAELRHVFEPFYRGQTARSAQIRGTGLGLSLAREAANSMGARITVKSAVGKGSAFTLHIPPAYMNSSTVPVEALVES
jgi:signal transduction histidine kinase